MRNKGEKKRVERAGEAAQGPMFVETWQLQRVAALAKRGDELRAEKLNWIKERIEQGTYHVDAADVAKGIIRSAISRLLSNGRCTLSRNGKRGHPIRSWC